MPLAEFNLPEDAEKMFRNGFRYYAEFKSDTEHITCIQYIPNLNAIADAMVVHDDLYMSLLIDMSRVFVEKQDA